MGVPIAEVDVYTRRLLKVPRYFTNVELLIRSKAGAAMYGVRRRAGEVRNHNIEITGRITDEEVKDARLHLLDSLYGHDMFLKDAGRVGAIVAPFLGKE